MTRRGRAVLALSSALALAAFALGVALGGGAGGGPERSAAQPAPTRAADGAGSARARGLDPAHRAGLRIAVGMAGTGIAPQLRSAIRGGRVAALVLYAADFPTRAAGRRLIAALQAIPRPRGLRDPLLIMVDQEGGLVKRVAGPPSASARQMGARGPAFSRRQGLLTGRSLRALGVNVNLAPVLDIGRPGSAIAADDRAFGTTAARVAATAVPFAEGMRRARVAAAAKHFPGLGGSVADTDVEVARIGLPAARLRAVDEAPFRAFAAAGGEVVMLSSAIYPALDSRPAAFSRAVVTGELRRRVGFGGVILTDALGAAAAANFGGPARAGLAAARAGADLLLYNTIEDAARGHRALVAALRSGALDPAEFEAAAGRVLALRAALR